MSAKQGVKSEEDFEGWMDKNEIFLHQQNHPVNLIRRQHKMSFVNDQNEEGYSTYQTSWSVTIKGTSKILIDDNEIQIRMIEKNTDTLIKESVLEYLTRNVLIQGKDEKGQVMHSIDGVISVTDVETETNDSSFQIQKLQKDYSGS